MKKELKREEGRKIAMGLRRAYLTFHRRANQFFKENGNGITTDQFVVLTLIAKNPGQKQADLVKSCGSDPNTITAIIKLLLDKKLIRRERLSSDQRAYSVELTDTGREIQSQLWLESNDLHLELLSQFSSKDEVSEFIGILKKIEKNFS